jgi:hypothetical protein
MAQGEVIMKRIVALLIAGLMVSTASAGLTLPQSDYINGQSYDKDYGILVQYKVYDTTSQELDFMASDSTDSRYVYAYAINNTSSNVAVKAFALAGMSTNALTSDAVTYADLDQGGVAPGYGTVDEEKQAYWDFSIEEIAPGEYSMLLLVYSNAAPVMGTFEINPENGVPAPGVPEPATLVLLTLGGLLSLRKRK